MRYDDKERYQYKGRLVKAYRWLRYRPKWFIVYLLWISCWFIAGAEIPPELSDPKMTKRKWARSIWQQCSSMAHAEMGYVYYLDEIIKKLETEEG